VSEWSSTSRGLWVGGGSVGVGRDIPLNGESFLVIGIAPAAYALTVQLARVWSRLQRTALRLMFTPAAGELRSHISCS
jgi:hypothetical protein